ncbi:hypothetical protein DFH09DRAFT_1493874 [Mycena vulgaris]|nr:hypothetical protein DFH09DRAFT_1493874 [Mycena vulgaris]
MSEQKAIQGLVFVYLETGPDIKEDDLNDWYDNEHAPRRLTVPGYVTATRYKAADSKEPTWLTLYDIETPEVTTSQEYEALGALGSENEKMIMTKLKGISRRAYTLLGTTVHPETTSEELPGKYVLAVSFEIAPENEDDFNRWYDEEHMDLVACVPGWKRGRRYKLVEYKQSGQLMTDQLVPKYLAIHELDNGDFDKTVEIAHARSTEWAQRVFKNAIHREVRKFELHKVFG